MLTSKKSAALLAAIKEYDANKWKVIGQKVGKPAKVLAILSSWISESELTGARRASNMQRSILVGSTERFYDHSLHLTGFSKGPAL